MKNQIISFGGGLVTGLCLFVLLSASMETSDYRLEPTSTKVSAPLPNNEYVEVPIGDFFKDVARYNKRHAELIATKMPAKSKNKLPSRMFTYYVQTLESFLEEVKRLAATGGIPPDKVAIRFYYGVYPIGQKVAGENYSSLHTLFMVPNYWSDKDKKFWDLDIRKLAVEVDKNGWGNYADHEDLIRTYYLINMFKADSTSTAFMLDASALKYTGSLPVQKAGFFPSLTPPLPPVINQGQLCPPNCVANTLLDYVDSQPELFPGKWER